MTCSQQACAAEIIERLAADRAGDIAGRLGAESRYAAGQVENAATAGGAAQQAGIKQAADRAKIITDMMADAQFSGTGIAQMVFRRFPLARLCEVDGRLTLFERSQDLVPPFKHIRLVSNS